MNRKPQISVILPVYNVEKYISNCIDSILNQTFNDFELIIVNDGSLDKSGVICDDYQKRDRRISVIHKNNGGVTAARRDGWRKSVGEWICFVDADDILPLNSLKDFSENISSEIDLVVGCYETFSDTPPNSSRKAKCIVGTFQPAEIINMMLLGKYSGAPWAKMFRNSIIVESVFDVPPHITNKEDIIMNYKINTKLKNKVKFIESIVYKYRTDRVDSAFNKRYANKKLNVEYEISVFQMVLSSLYTIEGFPKGYEVSYSQMCYDTLWYWKRGLISLDKTKERIINQLYKDIKFFQIKDFPLIKRTLKMIIIKTLIKTFELRNRIIAPK